MAASEIDPCCSVSEYRNRFDELSATSANTTATAGEEDAEGQQKVVGRCSSPILITDTEERRFREANPWVAAIKELDGAATLRHRQLPSATARRSRREVPLP